MMWKLWNVACTGGRSAGATSFNPGTGSDRSPCSR